MFFEKGNVGGELRRVAENVVCKDTAALCNAVLKNVKVIYVFTFGGIEKGEIEKSRSFGNGFRRMTCYLGNIIA